MELIVGLIVIGMFVWLCWGTAYFISQWINDEVRWFHFIGLVPLGILIVVMALSIGQAVLDHS